MNILIIKTSSMGDIIHTLPAVSDANNIIPNLSFDWVVEENFAEIPKWHPAIKNIIPVAIRRWRHNLASAITNGEISWFLKNLRNKRYDYIIDAQGLMKSAIITLCAHGTKCGYDKNSARESLASLVYKNKFTISKKLHAVTRIRKLFAATLNYEFTSSSLNYGIDTEIFPRNSTTNYLFFIHGTSSKSKCWQDTSWRELASLATSNNYKIKLPWSNSCELQRAKMIAETNPNIEILPKLNLTDLAQVIINAKGVVAIDTGLGHLATALDVPTISLYGPTDPAKIGTKGNSHQIHLTNFNKISAATVWQKIVENFPN